jgi:hypothetical protein
VPTDADNRTRRQRLVLIAKSVGAVVTFLIAVLGAVTGTIAWRDSRHIDVDIDASARTGFSLVLPDGHRITVEDITVAVVNKSARGVTLTEGRVLVAKTPVGTVSAAAAESGSATDEAAVRPTPLPRTIPSNGSSRLRLQWRPLDARARLLAELAERLPPEKRDLMISLRFEPGRWQTVRVRVGSSPLVLGGWAPLVTLAKQQVVGMGLQALDAGSGPALATLTIWRQNSNTQHAIFTSNRPVAWGLPAFFPLPKTRPGAFLYSLAAEDQTVAAGRIRTPCAGSDGSYSAVACADGNAVGFAPIYP